jgi:hypothetical protein
MTKNLLMNCDDLEWFVDVLGTDEIMKSMASLFGEADLYWEDTTCNGTRKGRRTFSDKDPVGVFFSGSHWYARRFEKGKIRTLNSYDLDYQIKGTAHFCQIFALIIYLGLDRPNDLTDMFILQPKQFTENIRKAVLFVEYYLEHLGKSYFIQEVKNAAHDRKYAMKMYSSRPLSKRNVVLTDMNWSLLKQYLRDVSENARYFIHCKQTL